MDLLKLTSPELISEFFSSDKSRQGIISEKEASGVLIENDSKVVTETEKLFPLAGEMLVFSEGKIFIIKPDAELKRDLENFDKESEDFEKEIKPVEEIAPSDPIDHKASSDNETKKERHHGEEKHSAEKHKNHKKDKK